MNLGIVLADVEPDHLCGMDHGLLGTEFLPGMRAEMIATEQNALARKADSRSNLVHAVAKIRGRHSGVASELIDLIAGSFDEQRVIANGRVPHGGFDNPWVRRTHRVDSTVLFAGTGRSKILQAGRHGAQKANFSPNWMMRGWAVP